MHYSLNWFTSRIYGSVIRNSTDGITLTIRSEY
ncbi:unnamed protein product [Medioppia subpectinata]|uniref:Uncharacterized protein n=1 Tax=Medioppia subpectinata TaxID=1979941 RepID=A0A7R9LSW0_9ACAR|nr:unnamed protein product [Medioppia subpectinata]CAG2121118.1 unnamed protein product [Medioppia subpectinata]